MATFTDVQHTAQRRTKDVARQAEDMSPSFYFTAVIGSIAASALLFLMGRRNLAIFVGLWPPTILNMALFTKHLHPAEEMERMEYSGRQSTAGVQHAMDREMDRTESNYGL